MTRSVTDGSDGSGERLGMTQGFVESYADSSIKKRVCAFIVPIGSRGRFKTFERAAVEPRYARRIEEHDLPAAVRIRQRAEQRQVILAAEEHNIIFRVIRQHPEIVISIRLATAFIGVGARAEGDVIRRRQKTSADQTPASRQDINILRSKAVHKPSISLVLVELIGGIEAKRIAARIIVVLQQKLSPRGSFLTEVIGPGACSVP